MGRFVLRRTLISIPTLLGISLVIFTILSLAPGDPFSELVLNPNVPPEVIDNLREQYGLNEPPPIRYVKWLTATLSGEFGWSFASKAPVRDLIAQRLPVSIFLLGTAYIVGVLIALPVGVISAVRQYSVFDQVATTLAFFGFSMPTFFTGLLFILLFSINLGWFPFIYSSTLQEQGFAWLVAQAKQSVMPIAVLALFEGAILTRFIRASMLDVIKQEYVQTARAKGLSERGVLLGHVLRNALIPVVTVLALQLPTVFTGAVVTEQIFRVPGMGLLLINAIRQSDTPVVMAITFIYAMMVLVFNFLADILYGVLDPRIRYA